ncbi:MAG TPA: (Fe-S)-binding protein [Chitinophagales bacterium]|nr:(Fe-S)-binding protein [Chitinophagales bacterium]
MQLIQIALFILLTATSMSLFFVQGKRIYKNIMLGRKTKVHDDPAWGVKQMFLIAFGQKKMFKITSAALLHLVIYVAFLITQIELIEVFIDGFTGKHRAVYHFFEDMNWSFPISLYYLSLNMIEILSVLAFFVTIAFLWRRNIIRLPRLNKPEMDGWPRMDGNLILLFELILIICIFSMNIGDGALQLKGTQEHYPALSDGLFLLSGKLAPYFVGWSDAMLIGLERFGWWGHIIMVFVFLNYIPNSKHLHIMLAFPNTYFSRKQPQGEINNMPQIMNEVKSMFDDSMAEEMSEEEEEVHMGAKDATDLTWKNLLEAYSCTECGRCTEQCPANQTGKLLSPRKIMMDTRDRIEDIGKGIKEHGPDFSDNKTLLGDYITQEELLACTTCNACVEACPVNISPLEIIVELRRALAMDLADTPQEWNTMFTSMENNQAPWQFSPDDRTNWKEELNK